MRDVLVRLPVGKEQRRRRRAAGSMSRSPRRWTNRARILGRDDRAARRYVEGVLGGEWLRAKAALRRARGDAA